MKYNFESDNFSVDSLINFVQKHSSIPHNKESVYYEFMDLCKVLLRFVPQLPGWYAWVRVYESGVCPIYVGRSFMEKTSNLNARLLEEFGEEYVAFWSTVHDPCKMREILNNKNLSIGYKDYTDSITRSIRKKDTTHIVWVGTEKLSKEENIEIEDYLISRLKPLANLRGLTKKVSENVINKAVLNKFINEFENIAR